MYDEESDMFHALLSDGNIYLNVRANNPKYHAMHELVHANSKYKNALFAMLDKDAAENEESILAHYTRHRQDNVSAEYDCYMQDHSRSEYNAMVKEECACDMYASSSLGLNLMRSMNLTADQMNLIDETSNALNNEARINGKQSTDSAAEVSEQKAAERTEDIGAGAPDTGMKFAPAESYSAAQRKSIRGYLEGVSEVLKKAYTNFLNGTYKTDRSSTGPKVGKASADKIEKVVGFDVNGYEYAIAYDGFQHINNRHGEQGVADHSKTGASRVHHGI